MTLAQQIQTKNGFYFERNCFRVFNVLGVMVMIALAGYFVFHY